ncbi:MAG: HD-GYP domain-containing protein [Lachnospiraceae bacterium]
MKRISIAQLIPGMVTAEDIFSYNGQLLIPKGNILTDNAITILQMYDIISIRIDDSSASSETAPVQPYSARIKSSAEFQEFKTAYNSEIEHLTDSLQHALVKNSKIDADELLEGTLSLMGNVRTASGVFDMLHCMREYDDSTFAHCINVALICNVAAKWLDMPEEDIRTATSCGLFHDIGKLQIPKSILGKPAKLTADEYDIIKKHPSAGYRLLQERGMNEHICNAALMHHERCDGTGYPFGLKGSQLDRFAKLVSIADVYDATTASRVYRGPLCPFTVIGLFEQEGLQKYEPQYIMTFLENVVNTYISNRCRLSNGQEGDIVYINKDHLSRPMIQCGNEYINLAQRPELSIECLL